MTTTSTAGTGDAPLDVRSYLGRFLERTPQARGRYLHDAGYHAGVTMVVAMLTTVDTVLLERGANADTREEIVVRVIRDLLTPAATPDVRRVAGELAADAAW